MRKKFKKEDVEQLIFTAKWMLIRLDMEPVEAIFPNSAVRETLRRDLAALGCIVDKKINQLKLERKESL